MKKLTATALLCLCTFIANAENFLVTSNADSGPGTLREAITAANANGTATTDLISFSLSDTSTLARTITLLSELPLLTSNITIDGTTQPGAALGVSDAKIILERSSSAATYFAGLAAISANDLAIYGLYIRDFLNDPNAGSIAVAGIKLGDVQNVHIGDVGKGNVISGNGYGIYHYFYRASGTDPIRQGVNISIKSNIIGLQEDGFSLTGQLQMFGVQLWNAKNITVGGDLPGEGNLISGNRMGSFSFLSELTTGNGFIKVVSNRLGFDYTGTRVILPAGYPDGGNQVAAAASHSMDYDLEIRENKFSGFFMAMWIWELSKPFRVVGNEIGVVKPDGFSYANQNGIYVYECATGVIGGDGSARNIIANSQQKGVFSSDGNTGYSLITVTKNSIYCNGEKGIGVHHIFYRPLPVIYVNDVNANGVKGKAKPGSTIEIFYDDSCVNCEGKTYIGSTKAGADSTWTYTGTINGGVVATSTEPSGLTSEFSKAEAEVAFAEIKHASCGRKNGSVTNIQIRSGTRWHWENVAGQVVSTDTVLLNVPAGDYRLVLSIGTNSCQTVYGPFEIRDVQPPVLLSSVVVQPASCGQANGKITVADFTSGFRLKWLNSAADSVGNDYTLDKVLPGTYSLKLFAISDTTCTKTYGPYTVQNQSGPSLQTSAVKISPATCGKPTGSITGITFSNATGTQQILWVDSLNTVVGTSFDLLNVPPGKYRLKFKDASGCDTIVSAFYNISNSGTILVDTTARSIAPAKCSGEGGSIRGIKISGGDNVTWKNTATGNTVGNTLDIFNLSVGNYQLSITNTSGCSLTLPPALVPQAAFQVIEVADSRAASATCGQINGFVEIKRFNRDTSLYSFRWVDSATSQIITRQTSLYNVPNGTYRLFVKDSNGCERQIMEAILIGSPIPSFDYTRLQIKPDKCLSGSGAIEGVAVKDLYFGTTTYAWVNNAGDTIATTPDVRNVGQGNYQLKVENAGCRIVSQLMAVDNINVTLPAPQYNDEVVLKNTAATLKVKNNQPGRYLLYDDPAATTPLQENSTGIFTTPVLTADQVFYVQCMNGVCSSEVVAITVKVVDRTGIYVPSAFSPNGDGKNDVLKVLAYGKIKPVYFTVYNRWGQVVFSTQDFSRGWNGTINGQPLEAGVYVWMVKAVDEMSGAAIEQKGTVAIIR